ncbi:MAG: PLP-dependent aminotransferase family protein, partial [Planctomycetota bacterium]
GVLHRLDGFVRDAAVLSRFLGALSNLRNQVTGALYLFEVHGVHCRTVPIGPHGISSGELDRALSGERPRLVHLIPSFHNPTGWTMSLEERRFVLERCQEDRIPIFEDDYGPGLRFEGAEPPTLLAMSPQGGVVQSGTLSKIAFPGFRIGWLLVPREIYSEIHEIRRCSDLGGSLFPQMVLYEFWRRGGLERHVKKVRREYGARRDALLEALSREMPDGTRWSEPSGGLVLWLELPDERDALELLPEAAKAGVLFAPGAFFHPSGRGGSGLRLSFGSVPADRIAEGIRRLGRVLARTSRSGTRRSGGPSVTDSSLAV